MGTEPERVLAATSPPEDVRFQNRLWKQRPYLLGCLEHRDVESTNNRAGRALRLAVVARKISCGNKTARRAKTFERLANLAATW